MKHVKIYERYQEEMMMVSPGSRGSVTSYSTETTDIKPTDALKSEGNYIITFTNAEGQDVTMEISGASNPEYKGERMTSPIEVISGSSSDGREYSVTGHYKKVPGGIGEYELKKVLVGEI